MKAEYIEKVRSFLDSGRALKLAVAIGIAGVALIFISNFFEENEPVEVESDTGSVNYISWATSELEEVVASITGEKAPKVYITAETGTSRVYASEFKESDKSKEETVVIIKDKSGSQTGLLLEEQDPEIKGVVIVSSRADEPVICEMIIKAAKTAFDLPSNKVCVVSKSK